MLTKTDFLWYLDAPMHLWARSHDRIEIKSQSPYEQHLIQQGQQVEVLAKTYIEQSLLCNYQQPQLLWQPTYQYKRFETRADAVIFEKSGGFYDLYEIKSSTSIHTEHEYDVTFQVLILETVVNLRAVYLIHIDNTYQLGQKFELNNYFVVEEMTARVEQRRDDVARWREEALAISQSDVPDPSFACNRPKSCPCPALCHPDLPKNPIYNIPYIGKKTVRLREMGITAIEDIPKTFDLNLKQAKHVQAVKTQQPVIDIDALQESLAALHYPLYFLDYETFNPAVPLFEGYHPYEHIVFQYSLHKIDKPGYTPQHYDCLITEHKDPAPEIVPHLLNHIGITGSVIVWNKSFEANRNKDLARHCKKYTDKLENINNRLYDLMLIFKNGAYIHPDFHGSASLKAVLPVLCPELRYEELNIQNGEEAMMTWYWIQTVKIPPQERVSFETAMKEYCKLDTYGMVAILGKMKEVINKHD